MSFAQVSTDNVEMIAGQWVKTNFKPNMNTKVILEFAVAQTSSATYLFGNPTYKLYTSGGHLYFEVGDRDRIDAGEIKANVPYVATMSPTEFILDTSPDATLHAFSKTYPQPSAGTLKEDILFIGGFNSNKDNALQPKKIYQCLIFDGKRKKMHFVPARNEGKAYFYEVMAGEPYQIEGSDNPRTLPQPANCKHPFAFPTESYTIMHCPTCATNISVDDYKQKSDMVIVSEPNINPNLDVTGCQTFMVTVASKADHITVLNKSEHNILGEAGTQKSVEIPIPPIDHVDTLLVLTKTYIAEMRGTRQDTVPIWVMNTVPYMPVHRLTDIRTWVEPNLDEKGLRNPQNVIEFAIDNVKVQKSSSGELSIVPMYKQDLHSDDIFMVDYSTKRDFSSYTRQDGVELNIEKKPNIEVIREDDGTERYRLWYRFVDSNAESQVGYAEKKDSMVCAIDPRLLEEGVLTALQRSILKSFYTYPLRKIYYRVQRVFPTTLWTDKEGYEIIDSLILSNVVPGVDSIRVTQNANWANNKKVNVSFKMMNPYPWEYNTMLNREEIQAYAELRGVQIARRYMWDKNASVIIERKGYDENNREVPDAARTFTVEGSKIQWNESEGCYYASVQDVQNLPFIRYYYTAVVKPNSTKFPIANTTPVRTSDKEAAMSRSETAMLVSDFTVSKGTDRGCVVLEWKNDDMIPDMLTVERRPYDAQNENGEWQTLSSDPKISFYKDETAKIGQVYEYRLTIGKKIAYLQDRMMTTQLSGLGWASWLGKLSGRIMMNDGTAMPHVRVEVTREKPVFIPDVLDKYGNIVMQGVNEGVDAQARPMKEETDTTVVDITPADFIFKREVMTDDKGYWSLDGVYVTDNGLDYEINIKDYPGTFLYKSVSPNAKVQLTSHRYENTEIDFRYTSTVKVTGFAYYENSTVAVPGAHFYMDGKPMYDSRGELITTQPNGSFSLTVPSAKKITLEIRKDGHRFVNDGFIRKDVVIDRTLDGLMLYDLTKVRVAGRLTGGNIQGSKPMGAGLSTNNLGDHPKVELMLEGDVTASLVHYITDPDRSSVEKDFEHKVVYTNKGEVQPQETVGKTHMKMDRKRIYIDVDPATGEFMVDLFPAKYRVSQMSADGYSTLYTAGEGILVVDYSNVVPVEGGKEVTHKLNDTVSVTTHYDATFQRTYHAPLSITYKNIRSGREVDFYGEQTLNAINGLGQDYEVTLYDKEKKRYTFGYPVFRAGRAYIYEVSAHEDYHYNNVVTGHLDIVPVGGDSLIINDGIGGTNKVERTRLNNEGKATVLLEAGNTVYNEVGDRALRTTHFTVINNGLYSEGEPLKGFVLGEKLAGTDVVPLGTTIERVDILRDPPGSKSYAYREAGTTYTWSYDNTDTKYSTFNFDIKAGLGVTNCVGFGAATVFGFEVCAVSSVAHTFNKKTTRTMRSYSFTASERISTSSGRYEIGAGGDVYIGRALTYGIAKNIGITAVDSTTFKGMNEGVKSGAITVVAEDSVTHGAIVVGDKYSVGESSINFFAYSQKHILTSIIPSLEAQLSQLVTVGDSATVLGGDSDRARYWLNQETGEIIFKAPAGDEFCINMADSLIAAIEGWKQLIADNEKEKLDAIGKNQPAREYSISDAPTEYSEKAESYSNTINWNPSASTTWSVGAGGGMKPSKPNEKGGGGNGVQGNVQPEQPGQPVVPVPGGGGGQGGNEQGGGQGGNARRQAPKGGFGSYGPGLVLDVKLTGGRSSSGSFDQRYTMTNSTGYGFHLESSEDSYLDVAVHNVTAGLKLDNLAAGSVKAEGVPQASDATTVHNYVFQVKGGAQRNPWVAPDSTIFYNPGTPLGERTLKIDNPKIYVDEPVVSNVARDDNAVFSIRLSNETEAAIGNTDYSGVTRAPSSFKLRLDDDSNPLGAKVYMDGQPISDGRSFTIAPGQSITKTIEVARGKNGYDYENLSLRFADASSSVQDVAKISVHYMPESSPLRITLPQDKWVLNTYSPQDEYGMYYLPIEIGDFNLNYENFHHIEMQYKKHNDGESQWVTLCSYFNNDSLMNLWTGTKEKIRYGSKIDNIRFYGGTNIEEQEYDLRAVSFCSFGNGYVTKASPVITGMKDTRRPEIFGVPSPANGILTFDDVIQFPYTERIAYNRLNATGNFTVRGYTNDTDNEFTQTLHFNGKDKAIAMSDVERVLGNRNFSVDMMVKTQSLTAGINITHAHLIFSHGCGRSTSEKYMNLYLLDPTHFGDWRLLYEADNCILVSESLGNNIDPSAALTRLGMVMYHVVNNNATTTHLNFIVDKNIVGIDQEASNKFSGLGYVPADANNKGIPAYTGAGKICVGNSSVRSDLTNADITEVRLWNKALDRDAVARTYRKRLNGYNRDLIAYWPMDEGQGDLAYDKVGGANLHIEKATWNKPSGWSLKADHREIELKADEFAPVTGEDYTLSMWFRTSNDSQDPDSVALMRVGKQGSNGSAFLGYKGSDVVYYNAGKTLVVGSRNSIANGAWHNFTLVRKVTAGTYSIYLDKKLASQGSSDEITPFADSYLSLGDPAALTHYDDIALWSKALSPTFLEENYNVRLRGTESDLMVFMPFEKDTIMADNTPIVTFSAVNHRMVTQVIDMGQGQQIETGKKVPVGTLLIKDDDKNDSYSAKKGYAAISDDAVVAPLHPDAEMSNLNFSWSSTGTALQININRPDKEINKQYIYVTVRDVEDEYGNTTVAPHMWTYFVDKNILKWDKQTLNFSVPYGQELTEHIAWRNLSGKQSSYTISTDASWISFSTPFGVGYKEKELSGIVDAEQEHEVLLHVGEGLSPGLYSTVIQLTDENDLTENLTLNLTVEPVDPQWTVDKSRFEYSMNMRAVVVLNESQDFSGSTSTIYDNDPRDMVGAFVGLQCVGVANISVNEGQSHVYMTIYGDEAMNRAQTPITLRLWRASTGVVNELARYQGGDLSKDTSLVFQHRAVHGMPPGNPDLLRTTEVHQQEFTLNPGWNWISFNVEPMPEGKSTTIVNTSRGFVDGDIIKRIDFRCYDEKKQDWYGSLQSIDNKYVYQVFARNGAYLTVRGKSFDIERTLVEIANGKWIDMPYYLNVVQPINIALADCKIGEKATVGDIIKSYNGFAVAGKNGWEGSLQYLRPGEGYYYYHNGDNTSFHYSTANNGGTQTVRSARRKDAPRNVNASSAMPVIAVTDEALGFEEGDTLLAYCGGELISEAAQLETSVNSRRYFLTVNAEEGKEITFAVKRDEQIIKAGTRLLYDSEKVAGSLTQPFIISLDEVPANGADRGTDDIYNIRGYKVNSTRNGDVYIINGKKTISTVKSSL